MTVSRSVGDARLLELADAIERSTVFNQVNIGRPAIDADSNFFNCGTPGCAIGHWRALHPCFNTAGSWTAPFALRDKPFDKNTFPLRVSSDACRQQITDGEALFSFDGCFNASTDGRKAAAYLRAFVAFRKAGAIPYHPEAK